IKAVAIDMNDLAQQSAAAVVSVVGLEAGELFSTGRSLPTLLPFRIRHSVNHLPSGFIVELQLSLGGGSGIPFGQAVATKARKIHQIDILNILAAVQMGQQTPKYSGFNIGALSRG